MLKIRALTPIFLTTLVAIAAVMTFEQSSQAQTTFECSIPTIGHYRGMPTTYANTPYGYKQVIRWNSHYFSESGHTPLERCQEVTARFNRLYARPGGLDIITTGYLNGLPVIYSPLNGREPATNDNLLFTLKKGENAVQKIQQLFDIREGTTNSPLFESSADNRSFTVDFNKFLKDAPIENDFPSKTLSPSVPSTPTQPPSKPVNSPNW